MFDRSNSELTADVILCDLDAQICDENGFRAELHKGRNHLTWNEAGRIVRSMNEHLTSVSEYGRKRFRSTMMQIAFAFGPEFEQEFLRQQVKELH